MIYLALTQGVAEWLLPKVGLIDTIHSSLAGLISASSVLRQSDFVEGPIRIAMDTSGHVITLSHADYLLGTGDEPWGFIKLTGDISLSSVPQISREVLEREIYVINQRLQCLMIDGAFYHRKYENNVHTLLAGRGSSARHYSVGYVETIEQGETGEVRTTLCVGPEQSFPALIAIVEKEAKLLPQLIAAANMVLNTSRPGKLATNDSLAHLRSALSVFFDRPHTDGVFGNVEVIAGPTAISEVSSLKTLGYTYSDWMDPASPLSDTQRRILTSDSLDHFPLRILGPAGSGKTLLMQLLVVRKLLQGAETGRGYKILYIVHSEAMRAKVMQRFQLLSNGEIQSNGHMGQSVVNVTTLSEYCRTELQLELEAVLDPDASDAKLFQLEQVHDALLVQKDRSNGVIVQSPFFREVFSREELIRVFAKLTLAEISIAIKGHGLENDKKRYVESERRLSRLHGILSLTEREFIFQTFMEYHRVVFEEFAVLDPDDIALSLAGRLRTPVWQLRRRSEGFDYIFVDEAQLFNENERRVLPLLAKGNTTHVPIALALDEAQALYSQPGAGLATLGIKDITNENLDSVYRSTSLIAKLAFFVIQKSTNLFGPDFPDFTKIEGHLIADQHPLAASPKIEIQSAESGNFGKFIVKRVRELRRVNTRQIVVICHADIYWPELESELSKTDLPFQIMRERGEKLRQDQPIVVLCRPAQVGGQEFDAAIIVGLEMGLVPPKTFDNEALGTAIEQQTIRETYLSITRARYRVLFALKNDATPNQLLTEARQAGLLK